VAEVSAVAEVKSDKLVAWLEACHEYGHVCLSAGVGLHVGVFGSEETFHTFDSKSLNLVYDLASAVVTVSGIAFGILVCQA
jgi:hypothetical protein